MEGPKIDIVKNIGIHFILLFYNTNLTEIFQNFSWSVKTFLQTVQNSDISVLKDNKHCAINNIGTFAASLKFVKS